VEETTQMSGNSYRSEDMKRAIFAVIVMFIIGCGGTGGKSTDQQPCDVDTYRADHLRKCIGAKAYAAHEASKREVASGYNDRMTSPDKPNEVRGCERSSMYDISHVCSFVGYQNCVWSAETTSGPGSAYEVVCTCVTDETVSDMREGSYCG